MTEIMLQQKTPFNAEAKCACEGTIKMGITLSQNRQCLQTALRMLGRRDHGVQELKGKLQAKGHPPEAVQWTIDECIRFKYLDDEKYAAGFTRSAMRNGYGPMRIRQKLKAKGIDEKLISAAVDMHYDKGQQSMVCRSVLQKKLKTSTTSSDPTKFKAKLSRFLFNRGFKSETVHQAITTCFES